MHEAAAIRSTTRCKPAHHVRRVVHHEDKVRHCWGVHRTTSTGTHNNRYLRNHTRSIYVLLENVAVSRKTVDALLDSCSAGIIQTNNRRADSHGKVHHLEDLFCVSFRQRTAEHRKVLREGVHWTAIHKSVAGNNAIAGYFGGV